MKKKRLCGFLSAVLSFAFVAGAFSACKTDDGGKAEEPLYSLVIGSDDYAPYFYRDEDGEFAGIDVELAAEACRRIGRKAEFKEIEWSEKDFFLEEGKVDCLWGSFSMTGREDRYAWAGPYMKSRQVIAVRENSGINSFADLAGKSVAVQATSKSDELFSLGADERIPALGHVYCFNDFEHIFAALKNGYADAVAGHEIALRERMKNNTGEYVILEETLLSVDLGAAFVKENADLARLVYNALLVMQKDGFTANVLKNYGIDPEKVLTVSA